MIDKIMHKHKATNM